MLNTGIVLLTILIDFLIQILTIVEWITPSKNILVLAITLLAFRSRWTWNAFIPSFLVYFLPSIKSYINNHIISVQSMGKLDLLLTANSLTQHALFLKDRLAWLYEDEISFVVQLMQGDLSFKASLLVISAIFIFFGYFNWTSAVLESLLLHILLKHSSFGSFYRQIGKDVLRFADFALFYKNVRKYQFTPPFNLDIINNENEFTIIITESINTVTNAVTFTSSSFNDPISPEFIVTLKPIVSRMTESISDWTVDLQETRASRTWKWSKSIKFDYNSEELDFFHLFYNLYIE